MNIAIVYDSNTGTTAKAAEAMGKTFEAKGHQVQVQKISAADPAQLAEFDLICLGGWVKGWFIIKQHPSLGIMRFMEKLGPLNGNKAVVFCTYKLAIGSTLSKMTEALEGKGAQVVGQFKYRGPEPGDEFDSYVSSLSV